MLPPGEWAGSVAGELADRLAGNSEIRLCLPTGATPRPVYRKVAPFAEFSRTHLFLLDEFGLPEGDPARCDGMIAADLLDLLPESPAAFERLDPGAGDLEAECSRYASAVADGGLDLVILGLGSNGHLGLNEPGSTPDLPTRVVTIAPETRAGLVAYGARSDTTWGMTLGLAEILEAKEIWLLVTGARKREILSTTLHGPIGPDLPASYLRTHSNVVVWADDEAAGTRS